MKTIIQAALVISTICLWIVVLILNRNIFDLNHQIIHLEAEIQSHEEILIPNHLR